MKSWVFFRVLYLDDDSEELRVGASNGAYAGEVDVYVQRGTLKSLADVIRGFPTSSEDAREIKLGTTDSGFVVGYVHLHFRVIGPGGQCAIETELHADEKLHEGETAKFAVPVEPAAIDSFVEQLERVPVKVGSEVRLVGAA